jgi:hypothetical protein
VASLARRLGISRPQALRILRDAESAVLLVRDSANGSTDLSPALVDALRTLYAAMIRLVAKCAEAGLATAPHCDCCPGPMAAPAQERGAREAIHV